MALGLVVAGITLLPDRHGEWLVGAPMYITGDSMAGLLVVAGLLLVFVPEPGRDRRMLAVIVASTAVSLFTFLLGSASIGSP
jgi:hypothetical protein